MKKTVLLLFLIVFIHQLSAQDIYFSNIIDQISAANIKKDVYQLASYRMEGRETATKGQKLAAKYIYEEMRKAGILSYQFNYDSLSYFQQFPLYKKLNPLVSISTDKYRFENSKDFSIVGYQDYSDPKLQMIFIENIQDSAYLNQDYTNKAIVFLSSNLYFGTSKAIDIIGATHAKMAFYCNPLNSQQFETIIKTKKKWNKTRMMLSINQYLPNICIDSIKNPKKYFANRKLQESFMGPIRKETLAKIFKIKAKHLKKILESKMSLANKNLSATVDFKFKMHIQQKKTENIIACIPGTSKKDEYIVLSAHYDHLGKSGNQIFYGANDNASGTAALLELARSFQNAVNNGLQLKRSILFAAFTGEEKGLLGSKYFMNAQTVPAKKIIANLNMDMLGRVDDNHEKNDFVYLIGASDLNPKLKLISDSINHLYSNLTLDYRFDKRDNFYYQASDQASFVQHNIPAIFYFNGLHKDYHKTTDTPDKINYVAIKNTCKLIMLTAIELANAK